MFLINTNSTSGANGIPDRKNIKIGSFADNSKSLDYTEVIKANDTEFYAKKSNNTICKLNSNLEEIEGFTTDKTWVKLKEETKDLGSFGLRYFIKDKKAYKNIFIGEDEKILFTNTDFWYKKPNEDAVLVSKRFYHTNNEFKQINLTGPCMVAFKSGEYEIFTRPSEESTEIAKKIASLIGEKTSNIISMSCLLNNYNIVDKLADNQNAVDYIFDSEVATKVIMNNEIAMQKVDENEKIMMKILSILSGITTTGYTNIAGLVENTTIMNKIAKKPTLFKGLLNSDITVDAILENENTMNILFDDLIILNQFINNKKVKNKILGKETALTKVITKYPKLNIVQYSTLMSVVNNKNASEKVFGNKKSVEILSQSELYTEDVVYNVICTLLELNKGNYADFTAILNNETTFSIILNNETTFSIILNNETTFSIILNNETVMTKVIEKAKSGDTNAMKILKKAISNNDFQKKYTNGKTDGRLKLFEYQNKIFLSYWFDDDKNWNDAKTLTGTLGAGWRLPTLNDKSPTHGTLIDGASSAELRYLYQHKDELFPGMNYGQRYWSSTEYSSSNSWLLTFSNGNESTNNKSNSCGVVAVRKL